MHSKLKKIENCEEKENSPHFSNIDLTSIGHSRTQVHGDFTQEASGRGWEGCCSSSSFFVSKKSNQECLGDPVH